MEDLKYPAGSAHRGPGLLLREKKPGGKPMPESLLAKLWSKRAARQAEFRTGNGTRFTVLYPGHPGGGAGPVVVCTGWVFRTASMDSGPLFPGGVSLLRFASGTGVVFRTGAASFRVGSGGRAAWHPEMNDAAREAATMSFQMSLGIFFSRADRFTREGRNCAGKCQGA